jgi:hypothetical protein
MAQVVECLPSKNCEAFLLFFFVGGGEGVELQGLTLARQELYHFKPFLQPCFVLDIFKRGSVK